MMFAPFDVTQPWALLLAVLLLPVAYLWRTSRAGMDSTRAAVSLACRLVLVAAVVCALAGLRWVRRTRDVSVIFAVDYSWSSGPAGEAEAREFVARSLRQRRPGSRSGILVFGGDASYEVALSEDMEAPVTFHSVVNREYTDLAGALRSAGAFLPETTQKRIILLSDGNENLGDAAREAAALRARGVQVHVVPLVRSGGDDALLESTHVPPRVQKDEPFDIQVVVRGYGTSPRRGKLQVFCNGTHLYTEEMDVPRGGERRTFRLPQRIEESGFYQYEIVLHVPGDRVSDNNRVFGFTEVLGEARVLYVEGAEGQAEFLTSALTRAGLRVDTTTVGGLPLTVAELQNYDAVILSDVPAYTFAPEQMEEYAQYVRDLGGGLLLLGGPDSFGMGGFHRTPIEEVAPVWMDVRKKKHMASLAVVIVLDQSGSMGMIVSGGETKMAVANEGACRVIESLTETDQVGVLAVDTNAKWVTPLEFLTDKGARMADVRANRPGGGGIYVYTGVFHAFKALRETEANVKHVICFADGSDSEQKEGCRDAIREALRDEKITTTMVSMGDDIDTPWLRDMAKEGDGRFYLCKDVRTVPRIFVHDVQMIAKRLIVEQPFLPAITGSARLLEGIDWGHVPRLYGFVMTRRKDRAEVLLGAIEADDPLLARWQCGMGRAAAFTSDVKARWGRDWVEWEGYRQLWPQVVRWVMRRRHVSNLDTRLSVEGAHGSIMVDALTDRGEYRNFLDLRAQMAGPSGGSESVALTQVGPGRYEGGFACRKSGIYLATIFDSEGRNLGTVGSTLSYSPEYRDLDPNLYLLHRIAEEGGGRVLHNTDDVFSPREGWVRTPWALWPILAALAVVALFADILARRLYVPESVLRWWDARVRKAHLTLAAGAATLDRLRAVKEDVRAREIERLQRDGAELPEPSALAEPSSGDAGAVGTSPSGTADAPAEASSVEYTSRLLEAKRRARKGKPSGSG